MTQRDKSFYDVVRYGLQGKTYQQFVDKFALIYNKPQTDGFDWDNQIQLDFTYEQLDAELGVATLPTYVDFDSPGPYKSYGKASVATGKMIRFKHGFALDEKIIREQLIMMKRYGEAALTNESVNALRDLLFDSTDKLISGNHNMLTRQRMQVVSTGQLAITVDDNPQGLSGITFDFGIPADNKETLSGTSRWWTAAEHTTANEGSASDPIGYLKKKRKKIARKTPNVKLEMSSTLFDDLLTHSKVLTKIGLALYPAASTGEIALAYAQNLTDEALKSAIERLIGCPVVVRDSISYVEKYNKETGEIDHVMLDNFDIHNVAFVPQGKLGTIRAVEPIAVPDPAARLAYFDGGRTLIKQTFNSDTNTQYIQSECTALCVPTVRKHMYISTVTA